MNTSKLTDAIAQLREEDEEQQLREKMDDGFDPEQNAAEEREAERHVTFEGFSDMDDLDSAPIRERVPTIEEQEAATTIGTPQSTARKAPVAVYEERCPSCRGSGRFVSYTGRVVGECFKCKGKGKLFFRTPTEVRERAKQRAADRKQEEANKREMERVAKVKAWCDANPERWSWIVQYVRAGNTFALSLKDALAQWGRLTDNQSAAVDRAIAKDCETHRLQQEAAASSAGLDLSSLPSGFYAVPNGETRLKLRVSRPRDAASRWAGYIFVDDGAEYGQRQKYGRQAPGARYVGKCEDALRAILADPRAASAAYGHLVGACGVCGRRLEDEESVRNGIGPICARKFQ